MENKKLSYVIRGLAILILILLVIYFFNTIFGGYKKTIRKTIGLINSKVEESIKYEQYSDLDSYCDYKKLSDEIVGEETNYDESIEKVADVYGDGFKITYKIVNVKEVEEEDLSSVSDKYSEIEAAGEEMLYFLEKYWEREEIQADDKEKLKEAYEEYLEECGKVEVSAAYKFDLECKIKGGFKKKEFTLSNITVANVNGQWIIVSGAITPNTIYNSVIQ